MTEEPNWFNKDLVLGWKVTKGLDPQHWEKPDAKPGYHEATDVIKSTGDSIAHHTVIIAQSGSGKSFFLGRLVEEILIKTRSRVLILDQNSDFRVSAGVKDKDEWANAHYDRTRRTGFLVDEPTRDDFLVRWEQITKFYYGQGPDEAEHSAVLRLNWLKFPVDLLSEYAAEDKRDQLRHCHSCVDILADLASATENQDWYGPRFFTLAQEFCETSAKHSEVQIIDDLRRKFSATTTLQYQPPIKETLKQPGGEGEDWRIVGTPRLTQHHFRMQRISEESMELKYQRAARFLKYVDPEMIKFYFSRATELQRAGLIDPDIKQSVMEHDPKRLEVVDLPSIDDGRLQKMAMCTFLEALWQRARSEWEAALAKDEDEDDRVPTFVVVEEAHNAMPAKAKTPTEKKLAEQFRRIAAEGRKYGLFLVLVSQRPDKLDRMVMSECENRAVMRVGSTFVLQTTCQVLGLDGVVPRMTQKVLDFDQGRALLAGPWVNDEPTFIASAARRTLEGGRNLKPKRWAQPVVVNQAIQPSSPTG